MPIQLTNIAEMIAPEKPEIRLETGTEKGQYLRKRRWFMCLSFRGAPFHGWQRQPNSDSVQQRVEEALSTVLRCETPVVGAGRTDAGVNAREMWAHFDTDAGIDMTSKMVGLNSLVGRDVAIREIRPVRPDAHARFDALSRTYRYFAVKGKDPFLYPLAWTRCGNLDIDAMNEAASVLLETDDFTSFAKLHSDAKTNICKVTKASWTILKEDSTTRWPSEGLVFEITADRFLRNMVRAIVGTLVEVGRGKMTVDDFRNVIMAKDRCAAGQSMPGEALFLWEVRYPDTVFLND